MGCASDTALVQAKPSRMLVACVNLYWFLITAISAASVKVCNVLLVSQGFSAGVQFCVSAFLATEFLWWLPNVGVHYVFGAQILQPFRHPDKDNGEPVVPARASLWEMPYQLEAMRQARTSRVQGYWLDAFIYGATYACSVRGGVVVSTVLDVSLSSCTLLEICAAIFSFIGMLLYFDFVTFLLHWVMHTPMLYKRFHKLHHDIRHLSPWVNDVEADVEGLLNVFLCKATTVILAARLGLLHERPWLIVLFYAFTKWYGVMEHLNMTLPPMHTLLRRKHAGCPISSLLTLPAYHDDHHRYWRDAEAVGQLAVYTCLWDRLFARLIRRTTIKQNTLGKKAC